MVAQKIVRIGAPSREERILVDLKSSMDQPGGDLSSVLEWLEVAIQNRIWESLGHQSFRQFVYTEYPHGLGKTRAELLLMVQHKHRYEATDTGLRERMNALRSRVSEELDGKAGPERGGRPKDSERIDSIGISHPNNNTKAGLMRRLRRDDLALAEAVERGELSANQAAIAAGYREPRVSVPKGTYGLARYIRRTFTRDQIEDLITALREA